MVLSVKEFKEDESSVSSQPQPKARALNAITALVGECLCEPFEVGAGIRPSTQIVELHGIRFIGLGAVVDELTPRQRVYDTLEQLTTRTERLISIGYILDEQERQLPSLQSSNAVMDCRKKTDTIPLDVWNKKYPDDESLLPQIKKMVERIKECEYATVTEELLQMLGAQKRHPNRGNNRYLAGITAHNLGVVNVLAGNSEDAILLFKEAIALKEVSFGPNSTEVAASWDELGIQYFAKSDFEGSLTAFRKAHRTRSKCDDTYYQPEQVMVLNNIACCNYQMHCQKTAMFTLRQARETQGKGIGSSAQADLDLLHIATLISNCGYIKLSLKEYEEARSLFEEALLIQQSVLDDSHRAIRDTLLNMEFANVFHS